MTHAPFVLALCGAGAIAGAQSAPGPAAGAATGFLDRTISLAGRDHRYALWLPPGFSDAKHWPLIVFLNGKGECGTDGRRQTKVGLGPALEKEPERWPFVVVFPQKPDRESQWVDHEALVMAVLAATEKELRIDADSRFLTGLSQGGAGTWALGSKHADVFAAIAPVCGYGRPAAVATGLRSTPVWAFHGLDDQVVPPQQSRDLCAAVEQAGGSPVLTLYADTAHNAWDKAYRESELAEWFRVGPRDPLARALNAPEHLSSFRFTLEFVSGADPARQVESVSLQTSEHGEWCWRLSRFRDGSVSEEPLEHRVPAAAARRCVTDCVRRLARAGVFDTIFTPEPPGDYVAVDRSLGISGRSLSAFPKRFPVSAPASPQVEAIRAAAARIRELR